MVLAGIGGFSAGKVCLQLSCDPARSPRLADPGVRGVHRRNVGGGVLLYAGTMSLTRWIQDSGIEDYADGHRRCNLPSDLRRVLVKHVPRI